MMSQNKKKNAVLYLVNNFYPTGPYTIAFHEHKSQAVFLVLN